MALRKNLTLILGIIIAAVIVLGVTVRDTQLDRTNTAISISKIGKFSSL